MNKRRIEIIITSLLVVVLVFAWAKSIRVLRKKTTPKVKVSGSISVTGALKSPVIQEDYLHKKEIPDKNLGWVRDPFSGKVYHSGSASGDSIELHLNGIIWDEKAPVAMINDRIVKVGDKLGVNTIIHIRKDSVIISDGTKIFELRLEEGHYSPSQKQ